ncbi:alcohol dehydrogenase catalytic domain-containing protein [Streptomyces sp. NBC_01230]|uniref:alcohol dehydrogenase catalytic domain-containing protein n=1 Tax=Streptomyces sp. NBC_01230 TaxID=2903784 RepID=UPI002E11A0B7
MKTVGVTRFGGPEALRVFEVPEPHAGPGQVRVRVHAASVNPGDRYLRNGSLGLASLVPPYVPGMEAAGVLDEIGAGRGDHSGGGRVVGGRGARAFAGGRPRTTPWTRRGPAHSRRRARGRGRPRLLGGSRGPSTTAASSSRSSARDARIRL